jgi:hypothetical protein
MRFCLPAEARGGKALLLKLAALQSFVFCCFVWGGWSRTRLIYVMPFRFQAVGISRGAMVSHRWKHRKPAAYAGNVPELASQGCHSCSIVNEYHALVAVTSADRHRDGVSPHKVAILGKELIHKTLTVLT